jgi:hypothetical protein
MTAAIEAFRQARIHSLQHIVACERAGLRWGETSITEMVMARSAQGVTVVPFTQRAESASGADWIWWWVDGVAAYGMLVQAKRVTVEGRDWRFGFNYQNPGATSTQREVLLRTAAALDLLPVYALYLGSGDYRRWARCSATHAGKRCLSCIKRSISFMPALLAEDVVVNEPGATYERSVALEDLQRTQFAPASLLPALRTQLAPELLQFLERRQDGTLAIGRAMIDQVLRARIGAFSVATVLTSVERGAGHDRLGPMFKTIPDDTGHWGVRYFEHVLDPLRQSPPAYVLDIMANEFDQDQFLSRQPVDVAGIVVVQVDA